VTLIIFHLFSLSSSNRYTVNFRRLKRRHEHDLAMSKLSEYSKFDHVDSDDDSDGEQKKKKPQQVSASAAVGSSTSDIRMFRNPQTKRFVFEYKGRSIYEWEQSLSEVTIYIQPPPFIKKASQLECHILPNKLRLGQRGATTLFIDESTPHPVDTNESTWCLEEGMIVIYLQKANKGVVWDCALTGRFDYKLDPMQRQEVQKELMLERWQEENPGMDFRDATFNGSVPDPRTFMGGVKYE